MQRVIMLLRFPDTRFGLHLTLTCRAQLSFSSFVDGRQGTNAEWNRALLDAAGVELAQRVEPNDDR